MATTHEHVPIKAAPSAEAPSRRSFLARLAGILAATGAALAAWPMFRSLVPNVLYEPPKRFRIGLPDNYQEGRYLPRRAPALPLPVGRQLSRDLRHLHPPRLHGQVRTLQLTTGGDRPRLHLPCAGESSTAHATARSSAARAPTSQGPAPRPLTSYLLELSPETGELVVDVAAEVPREFRLVV